jgi:predicted amidohydrolase
MLTGDVDVLGGNFQARALTHGIFVVEANRYGDHHAALGKGDRNAVHGGFLLLRNKDEILPQCSVGRAPSTQGKLP